MNLIPAPPPAKKLYRDLGVRESATSQEIRDAFLRIAHARHPDVSGGVHHADFMAAAHAYEILMDPSARRQYDDTGADPGDSASAQLRALAKSLIVRKAFEVIAATVRMESMDLVVGIRNALNAEAQKIPPEIRKYERAIADAKRAAAEIQKRWKGAEAIREAILGMIDNQSAVDQAAKAALAQQRDAISLALSLIEEARYENTRGGLGDDAWLRNDPLNVWFSAAVLEWKTRL